MKNIVRLEIRKAFQNKLFWSAVIIGAAITLLSFVYYTGLYMDQAQQKQAVMDTSVIFNPMTESFVLFNSWIGGEPFSMGSSIYFFAFPLLVAIPYGWSYCEEKKNGYIRDMVIRSGRTPYYFAKYIAVFLSGGAAMSIPLVFNFLMSAMIFPAVTPNVIYDTMYGVFGGSLMSILYYTAPFLYIIAYLCIDFVFGGLIACISFAMTSVIKNQVGVVAAPFFLILALHYSRRLVYTSFTVHYKEISPLFFLRPAQAAYAASWTVIIVEAVILFLVTMSVSMIWERRHEIF